MTVPVRRLLAAFCHLPAAWLRGWKVNLPLDAAALLLGVAIARGWL